MSEIKAKWAPGFFDRADQERIHNRAAQFSTDRVRARMERNKVSSRMVIEETLDAIEADCKAD